MKSPIFRRDRRGDTIAALYGMIVAQARSPTFYRAYGVPDTMTGRLEMILLHTILFSRRVGGKTQPLRILGQDLFDLFCRDMDGNLREMGVSDLAVAGQMKQIGEAFYGRAAAYEAALSAGHRALAASLERNVFAGAREPSAGAHRLATYMTRAVRQLAEQEDSDLLQGRISFPDPEMP